MYENNQSAAGVIFPQVEYATVEQQQIADLKRQIEFLVDTFAGRDARQRGIIEHYEAQIHQMALRLAWFEGAGHSEPQMAPQ